jgi:hypothetical protein
MYSFKPKMWWLAMALFMFSSAVKAGERPLYEESKSISKVFPATSETSLEIINKYGSIHIDTWDKDSIRIDISVKVEAPKYSDADRLLDMAEFQFSSSSGYVLAKTVFGENVSIFRKNMVELMHGFRGNQRVIIDYKVSMPAGCKITLENKFGDIYLPEIEGDARIILSHGDLRAKRIANARIIEVKYGKVNIETIDQGDLDIGYSDLFLEETKELRIKSISSRLHVENAEKLNIDSKHDKFFLGTINKVVGDFLLSDLNIRKLMENLDVSTRYGDVNVDLIVAGFHGINLSGSFTDYTLIFDQQIAYSFDVILENGKDFSYPTENTTVAEDNQYDKTKIVKGTHATIPIRGIAPKVQVKAKSSYVKFSFFK